MIEFNASVTQILTWFHSEQHHHEIMVLWLSPEAGHQPVLTELIKEVHLVDSLIQENIVFVLLSPYENKYQKKSAEYEAYFRIVREVLPKKRNRVEKYAARLAENTRFAVPTFAADFNIKPSALPAIAVLMRYTDEVIIVPIRGMIDPKAILRLLTAVSDAVHKFRLDASVSDNWYRQTAELAWLALKAPHREADYFTALRRRVDMFFTESPEAKPYGVELKDMLVDPRGIAVSEIREEWDELVARLTAKNLTKAVNHAPTKRIYRYLDTILDCQTTIQRIFEDGKTIQERFIQVSNARKAFHKTIEHLTRSAVGSNIVIPAQIGVREVFNRFPVYIKAVEKLVLLIERINRLRS